MKYFQKLTGQQGFTLVQAIFIVVVLALLGAAMVRLLGVQTATSTLAVQQARAYAAARSGLEWGATRAVAGASCSDSMTIDTFQVTVSCGSQAVEEGTGSYIVYSISSHARFGSYGSPDYVSRTTEMKIKSN